MPSELEPAISGISWEQTFPGEGDSSAIPVAATQFGTADEVRRAMGECLCLAPWQAFRLACCQTQSTWNGRLVVDHSGRDSAAKDSGRTGQEDLMKPPIPPSKPSLKVMVPALTSLLAFGLLAFLLYRQNRVLSEHVMSLESQNRVMSERVMSLETQGSPPGVGNEGLPLAASDKYVSGKPSAAKPPDRTPLVSLTGAPGLDLLQSLLDTPDKLAKLPTIKSPGKFTKRIEDLRAQLNKKGLSTSEAAKYREEILDLLDDLAKAAAAPSAPIQAPKTPP
jgi:hypothetical protein